MGHKVGVDSVDKARINIWNFKEGGDLGVSGPTISPDHVGHAPLDAVFNNHGHASSLVSPNDHGLALDGGLGDSGDSISPVKGCSLFR